MTELWTRHGWYQRAEPTLQQANVLLLLDINDFKRINDSLGHQAGDRCLRVVAQRLAAGLDTDAVVGRFGGDELVAVATLTEPTHAQLDVLLDELTQDVELPNGAALPVGVSVGVAHLASTPTQPPQLPELLAAADHAMYTAKTLRTGWEVYSPALHRARPLHSNPVRRLRHHGPVGVQ